MAELVKEALVDAPSRLRKVLSPVGSLIYAGYRPLQSIFNRVLSGRGTSSDITPTALVVSGAVAVAVAYIPGIDSREVASWSMNAYLIGAGNILVAVGWFIAVVVDPFVSQIVMLEQMRAKQLEDSLDG